MEEATKKVEREAEERAKAYKLAQQEPDSE